jgi:hypothetical protein
LALWTLPLLGLGGMLFNQLQKLGMGVTIFQESGFATGLRVNYWL